MSSGTVLFRQSASLALPSSGSSSIQNQVDGLVSNFVKEASDPNTLSAILAGSLAYRFTKLATLGVGAEFAAKSGNLLAPLVRPASIGFGLASEVGAFEFTNRALQSLWAHGRAPLQESNHNIWSWSGPGGLKQGLLNSAMTFGLLKGAGHLARQENLILQHFFQSSAMVTGHQVSGAFGLSPRPEGTLAEQFLHAEATNLQLSAGMGLTHALAPGIHGWEKALDLSMQNLRAGGSPPLRNPFAPLLVAAVSSGPIVNGPKEKLSYETPERKEFAKISLLPMTGDPTRGGAQSPHEEKYTPAPPLLPEISQALFEKWKTRFPTPHDYDVYSQEILEDILEIRSRVPGLHEKLLEILSASPKAGREEQFYAAEGLRWIFKYNPLASSTGSFENAVLQFLIEKAVSDPQSERGGQVLKLILQIMETGGPGSSFLEIAQRFGYQEGQKISDQALTASADFRSRFVKQATAQWSGYTPADKVFLFNYVSKESHENQDLAEKMIDLFEEARTSGRYSPDVLEGAIHYARQTPLSTLVMDRILHVLIVEDHPAKLKELNEDSNPADPFSEIPAWAGIGQSRDEIVQKINGTRTTAYVSDIDLAHRIVTVALEAFAYLNDKTLSGMSRKKFYRSLVKELERTQPLTVDQLMTLLVVNSTALAWRIHKAWSDPNPNLKILIVSEEEMKEESHDMGELISCQCLFIHGKNGEPDRILLLERPVYDLQTLAGEVLAYSEITATLQALPHEGAHREDLPRRKHNRHDRMASEMIANYEGFNWQVRNTTNNLYEVSRRLGQNFSIFLRSKGEYNYFQRTSERLVREFFKNH